MAERAALEKRWILPKFLDNVLSNELNSYSEIERRILANRGICTKAEAEDFLNGLQQKGTDPFNLLGMKEAVDRLKMAIEKSEKIVVYGDYDADGVTATALLIENFTSLGGNISHYIPDRFSEGYGINIGAIGQIKESGAQIVLTVDCGIRAIDEIVRANELGLDVIITDHHQPGPEMPDAFCVIDPKQDGDEYPNKGIAGVGIAYKLAEAVCRTINSNSYRNSLDLVAIGTIADMAPLAAENRYLVREGLKIIRNTKRPGIINLCEAAGYSVDSIDATKIGFSIGPRINAAGRIDSAEHALSLLLTTDNQESKELAETLEQLNQKRRKIMEQTYEKAREISSSIQDDANFIFVADGSFHEGIVGLVASRLVDEHYRPAVVAVKGEYSTRASGRSVPEFHITNALEACADLLERYGGHSAAAGFSVANERLEELEERLKTIAQEQLAGQDIRPSITMDAVVNFNDLTWELQEFIEHIEPCGEGNPVPQFATADVKVLGKRKVGKNGTHLKLTLEQNGKVFDAIAFRKGEMFSELRSRVNIAYKLERSDYWNAPSLELNVVDIKEAGTIEAGE